MVDLSLHILYNIADEVSSYGDIKTAIVAAGGSIVVACLGTFAVIYQRRQPAPAPADADHDLELEPLVIELRRQIANLERVVKEKNAFITKLSNWYWERGINPFTNKPVKAEENETP